MKLPDLNFAFSVMNNDITGEEYVIIDAQETPEISSGIIVTNSWKDLITLRDAIDELIARHGKARTPEG